MPDTPDIAEMAVDPERIYPFDFGDEVVDVRGKTLLEHADETVRLFRAIRNGNARVARKIMRRILRSE